MLLHSGWGINMSTVDYGLKLVRCAFIGCDLEKRDFGGEQPAERAEDLAAHYRDPEDEVDENVFLKCKFHPTFIWTTRRCRFEKCELSAAWYLYRSTTNLQISLVVPSGSAGFIDELERGTQYDGPGRIHYMNIALGIPSSERRHMPTWPFANDADEEVRK